MTIETWNGGLDFAKEVVKESRRVGAIPLLILEDDDAYIEGLSTTPKDSLGKMGKHEYSLLSSTDAYVFIPGPPIAVYAPMIPREDGVAATAYNASWYESAEKAKVRGVRMSFGYVGKEYAKLFGKTPREIIDNQLKASLLDFEAMRAEAKPLMDKLQDGAMAELHTGSNKLTFSVKGELGIEDGIVDKTDIATNNNISAIVPGMIWKDVDPTTVSGTVKISPSVSRLGLIDEATLEFKEGKLVHWDSKNAKSKKMLDNLLEAVPEDKRVFSILSIGVNPEMKYGNAQDRIVKGSLGLAGFGFTGIVRNGALKVNGETVIEKGKITAFS